MHKLVFLYQKYWFIRCFWWLGIVIPSVPFVLISIFLLVIMHWPKDYTEVVDLSLSSNAEYLTLSAHGVKDTPLSWSNHLQHTLAKVKLLSFSNLEKQHISLGWEPFSNGFLSCSVAGKRIGNQLGERISKMPKLQAVHLIGHSCGSFVIYGLCETLKQRNASISVQATYLDPVSVYSGFLWNYGTNNFGRCADFSDAYIDTEDTVPGSNQALPHAYTFDVTQVRKNRQREYAAHIWPTIFYINAIEKNQVPIYYGSTTDFRSTYQKNTLIVWPINQ